MDNVDKVRDKVARNILQCVDTFECSGAPESPFREANTTQHHGARQRIQASPKRMHSALPEPYILNEGTEDEVECYGFKKLQCRSIVCFIVGILSTGLLFLIFRWKPDWAMKAMYTRCSLEEADAILIRDQYKQWFSARVKTSKLEIPRDKNLRPHNMTVPDDKNDGPSPPECWMRYFNFQKTKYIWDNESKTFFILRGLDTGVTCSEFYNRFTGYTSEESRKRRDIYGDNEIRIDLRPIPVLFFQEAMNPFYVFQIYSVCLWIFGYAYIYFSVAIVFMSLISITLTVYSTRQQSITLRKMVESSATVIVGRGEQGLLEVSEKDLVPGDLIQLPTRGGTMTCDAVLISGTCIVNESMLTGESVPITKTPLPNPPPTPSGCPMIYDTEIHKRHTLFCGTQILQGRRGAGGAILAVVVGTGFSTAKGELVRSILFPKPIDFKLHRDAIKFIGVLASIAFVGFVYIITIKVLHHAKLHDIMLKALDVFTIAVPPALPAAMTIGMVTAQRRLKSLGIFCISPQRINISGSLDVICFDKTGTLTEDHLELLAVSPVNKDCFEMVEDPSHLPPSPFIWAMATCHSLALIDGELKGDPLDIQMFNAIKWNLDEPEEDAENLIFDRYMPTIVHPDMENDQNNQISDLNPLGLISQEIGILRQFTFYSSLKRMSVITQTRGSSNLDVYVKGAPETISSLCDPSTVPYDFQQVLREHTQQGLRVLAVAWRPLEAETTYDISQNLERGQVECNLQLLGLIIMQNTLKPESAPVIEKLKEANLRTVMVTGDNILTAIHVARLCGMIGQRELVVEVEAEAPTRNKPRAIQYTPVIETHHCTTPGDSPSKINAHNGKISETANLTVEEEAIDISNYHFAMDGLTWKVLENHFQDVLPKIVARGTVFARMSPDQKAQLVENIQAQDQFVGMCGDGANDCGALKTAHAGISLSEAEASVASPFTSQTQNIECVPTLIREGRAALVTSFGVFKYMAIYSMIQFTSIIILNSIVFTQTAESEYKTQPCLAYIYDAPEPNLLCGYYSPCQVDGFPSDGMFMYWDIAITTLVALLIARNEAYPKLVSRKPQQSLSEPSMLFSLFGHLALQAIAQIVSFVILIHQKWYIPLDDLLAGEKDDLLNTLSHEGTTTFFVANFLYVSVAFLFSKGPPYRKAIYTNVLYTIALILLLIVSICVVMIPDQHHLNKIYDYFELLHLPMTFRLMILAIVALHFLGALVLENFISESNPVKKCLTCQPFRGRTLTKIEMIEHSLQADPSWPPLSSVSNHKLKENSVETNV